MGGLLVGMGICMGAYGYGYGGMDICGYEYGYVGR